MLCGVFPLPLIGTRKQVGEALRGHSTGILSVSERADGRHIVSRDLDKDTIILTRENRTIVWESKNISFYSQNGNTIEESV